MATSEPIRTPALTGGVRTALGFGRELYLAGRRLVAEGREAGDLVHLQADGTIDADFRITTDGEITAMASDGVRLVIAGEFQHINGTARSRLAMIERVSGKVLPWQADADGRIWTIAIQGKSLFVGGGFLHIGGSLRMNLASVDMDIGLVSETFHPDPDSEVRGIVSNGWNLYITGLFTRLGTVARSGVVRLNPEDGTIDKGWTCALDGPAFALASQGPHLYVGGVFATVNGTPHPYLAQVSTSDGSLLPWSPEPNAAIQGLTITNAGSVVACGDFDAIGGRPARGIARLDANTAMAEDWAPVLTGSPTAVTTVGYDVVVGGTNALDGSAMAAMAFLDGTTPEEHQVTVREGKREIAAATVNGDFIYLGGDFRVIDGRPRTNLARIHRQTRRVDAQWRVDADGLVRSLAGGTAGLWVGGDFTTLGGIRSPYLALLDGEGKAKPITGAPDGPVESILPLTHGVLVAGQFTHAGEAQRRGLAYYSHDGSLVASWSLDAQGPDAAISGLAALADGRVVAGGHFTGLGEGNAQANLAVFDPKEARTVDTPALTVNGTVRAVASHGMLAAFGGEFTSVGNAGRGNVAVWDFAANAVHPLDLPADGPVWSIGLSADAVVVGGDFTTLGTSITPHLGQARLDGHLIPGPGVDGRVGFLRNLR